MSARLYDNLKSPGTSDSGTGISKFDIEFEGSHELISFSHGTLPGASDTTHSSMSYGVDSPGYHAIETSGPGRLSVILVAFGTYDNFCCPAAFA